MAEKVNLKVICFYWIGDRWRKQTLAMASNYVNCLYRGVVRNLSIPFEFICFTNEKLEGLEEQVEIRKFASPVNKGVLPRMYMFSEESGLFGNQVLALDLDIVIVDSLDDIAGYQGLFASRSKFAPGQQGKLDGDITSFRAGPENEARLWTPFKEDFNKVIELTKGRERYWFREQVGNEADRWDILFPNQVVSYKRHVKRNEGKIPKNARIVSCHGNPRPHQLDGMSHVWLKRHWV